LKINSENLKEIKDLLNKVIEFGGYPLIEIANFKDLKDIPGK
jgi:hypothetical protein